MRLSGFGWVHSMNSPLRLCLCLVLVCLIAAGATGCDVGVTNNNAIVLSESAIILFEAAPLVLGDGQAALYTFVVKNSKEMQLVEAGDIIKKINNPSAATLKGTAKGNITNAIQMGGSNT
ncbi:MAG: hypothetical protein MUO97_11710, partial [Dehalococcoidia bacterium]|nr:hypothetical protein [Dehalococcoidia bacterium]